MKKLSKEEVGEILQRLLRQDNYNDIVSEIHDIADELNIDITDVDPDDEEEDVVIEDEIDWDAHDNDSDEPEWSL